MSDFYVYLHKRATDGRVFYVGKGHENRAWSDKGRNKYWHKIVGKHGFTVEILHHGLQEWYALELEIAEISRLRECGVHLANVTDGGDGVSGLVFSDESKRQMSHTHKARYASNPELRAAARRTFSAVQSTPELRASWAEKVAAATAKPEYRAALSTASRKMWADKEFRATHAEAMASVRSNPEYVERHREGTRVAKMRPEERARQSNLMKSLMKDPQRRAQISASTRLAYQSDSVKAKHKAATAAAFERPEVQANHRASMASPEVRAKISAAQAHKRIPVVCVESGARFESALDAETWLKEGGFQAAQHNAVRGACAGKRKSAYGLHWNYA